MKKFFIIANWKSNKTAPEARSWLEKVLNINLSTKEIVIIICPSFTLLPSIKALIDENKLPFKLGAQNVSPYGPGSYTGEINEEQIREFADYVIIGHSERRDKFGETDDVLSKKVQRALIVGLTPIYCIQNEDAYIPEGVTLVAYEPLSAIGTGNPDTPENAEKIVVKVLNKYPYITTFIYGGSVTSSNVRGFVKMEHISGVLVGGASLDTIKFATLTESASI